MKTRLLTLTMAFLLTLCANATDYGDVAYRFVAESNAPNGYACEVYGRSAAASSKTTITIPGQIIDENGIAWPTTIATNAFNSSNVAVINIQYGCLKIGTTAFSNSSSLKTVRIPSSVRWFGTSIFFGCKNMSEIYFNNLLPSLLDIDDEFFYNVPKSCKLIIPTYNDLIYFYQHDDKWNKLTVEEGSYDITNGLLAYILFEHTNGRTAMVVNTGTYQNAITGTLSIPQTVTFNNNTYTVIALADRAFENCTRLTGINLPSTITQLIGGHGSRSMANYNAKDQGAQFRGCTGLKSISLPTAVEYIPTECFANSGLTSIHLHYGIKEIGYSAFKGTPITQLTVPSSLTSFLGWEVEGMKQLQSLVWNVPYSLNLEPDASTNHFADLPSSMKLYVPVGNVSQYQNGKWWSKFKSNTKAGAYDFVAASNAYTVTKAATGKTQATAVEVARVYNPDMNASITTYTHGKRVTDPIGRYYIATALGDSCFAGASQFTTFLFDSSWNGNITAIPNHAFINCTALKSFPFNDVHFKQLGSIGQLAFYNSGLTGTVNLIDATYARAVKTCAFYNCPGITELFCNGYNLESDAFGGTTFNGGFRCYVPHYYLTTTRNKAATWSYGKATAPSHILPFFISNSTTDIIGMPNVDANAVDAVLPTAAEAPGLEFYMVTDYNTLLSQYTTTKCAAGRSLAAGEALLVKGIEPGRLYRMNVPTTDVTPTAGNMLVANPWSTSYTVAIDNNAYYYVFDKNTTRFNRQHNNFSIAGGSGYLKDSNKYSQNTYMDVDVMNYQINVGGTRVTLGNKDNVTGTSIKSGTVSYNSATNTLTLNNANIQGYSMAIWSAREGLTIELKGTNTATTIKGSNTNPVGIHFLECDGVTFTGGGTLNVVGQGNGNGNLIFLYTRNNSSMTTIKNCTIDGAVFWADDYEENLTIDNATVRGNGSFDVGNTVVLKNCRINKPAGGYFDNRGTLCLNGIDYSGEFEILPTSSDFPMGDVNGDNKVDVEDVNAVINIILKSKTRNDYPGNSDVNDDNKVDVEDVNAIINIILKIA
ncbi:MAG: leucine-rich repeat protein [Muribaculaceae bacterium]|nr:leucine-rich repeat protein [Muribaculaceae bacterium]